MTMTSKITPLRQRMYDDIGSHGDWLLQAWGGERVVDDQGDIVSVRNLGQSSDIHHEEGGVARCLCPQKTGFGCDLGLPLIQIAGVFYQVGGDAHLFWSHVIEHPIGLAKDPMAGDNLVSNLSQVLQGYKAGMDARGSRQSSLATFQCG